MEYYFLQFLAICIRLMKKIIKSCYNKLYPKIHANLITNSCPSATIKTSFHNCISCFPKMIFFLSCTIFVFSTLTCGPTFKTVGLYIPRGRTRPKTKILWCYYHHQTLTIFSLQELDAPYNKKKYVILMGKKCIW